MSGGVVGHSSGKNTHIHIGMVGLGQVIHFCGAGYTVDLNAGMRNIQFTWPKNQNHVTSLVCLRLGNSHTHFTARMTPDESNRIYGLIGWTGRDQEVFSGMFASPPKMLRHLLYYSFGLHQSPLT